MLNEHRGSTRHACNVIVHYDTDSQGGIAIIKDISRNGVRIVCRPTRELKGPIKLSPMTRGRLNGTSSYGQIVWNARDEWSGQSEAGVKLDLDRDWLEHALRCSEQLPDWDEPGARLDMVMGY